MANPSGWNYNNNNNAGGAPDFMEFNSGGPPARRSFHRGFPHGGGGGGGGRFNRGRGGFRQNFQPQGSPQGSPQFFPHRAPNRGYQNIRLGSQQQFQQRGFPNQGFRGRGGFRGRHGQNEESDITAYFHPSMLEDPWACLHTDRRGLRPPTTTVLVAADDEELQVILREIKEKKQTDSHQTQIQADPVSTQTTVVCDQTTVRSDMGDDADAVVKTVKPENERKTESV